MTTKPLTTKPPPSKTAVQTRPPLPDPPREIGDMLEYSHFDMLGDGAALNFHLQAYPRRRDSTILVSGRGYLCRHRRDLQLPDRSVYPDVLVAFDVKARDITLNSGYEISEVGKPPALALELASGSTGINDYTWKRDLYAGFGVQEYWRFDHTGGDFHGAPLGGDRLTPQGVYQPIELHRELDGVVWGYSEVLGLSLCWVPAEAEARLRFWDPVTESYIPDQEDEREAWAAEREARIAERNARIAAEDQAAAEREGRMAEREARMAEREARMAEREARIAAEDQAAAEREARTAAEERIRQLEQELRRLRNP